ncbi:GPALPP motifs-containing protein 1 [Rhodotorula paludigena]|uniref:GPALPP motifs-containing protein 1 n=1 Tax=Rhodotorula paludigena TaxID=86838 RepID=UPI00316DECDC
MGIGPELPPHLTRAREPSPGPSASSSVGPAPPPPRADDSDDDDYGPALPPELAAERVSKGPVAGPSLPEGVAGPSRPPAAAAAGPQLPPHLAQARAGPSVGPALPPGYSSRRAYDDEDDDDDAVGPMPLPAGYTVDDNEGARQFREREEREKEQAKRDKEDQKVKREEWMLVPPKEMDLLSSIDTTKLKSRGFATGKAAQSASAAKSGPSTLWTETPAERQQRLEDEMLGRKRKAENAPVEDESDDARRKRLRDLQLRAEVERHNASARSESLVDKHTKDLKSKPKNADDERAPTQIWDRDSMMGVGGRLMDDGQRANAIKNAKGLGGRFSGGSFM